MFLSSGTRKRYPGHEVLGRGLNLEAKREDDISVTILMQVVLRFPSGALNERLIGKRMNILLK